MSFYREIMALNDLTPSKEVNSLFSQLVKYALTSSKNKFTKAQINSLQLISSKAEFELERFWTEKIVQSKNPKKTLSKFPYLKNYQKLTQIEWYSLLSCTSHKKHNILFAGGGPLPLTAIVLAEKYNQHITILDIDKTACELAIRVVKSLKLEKRIKIINSDASCFADYKNFNVIMIAALAGTTKYVKQEILKQIKSTSLKGTHILARSSFGARELLYRPLDKKLYKFFTPILEVRPLNDVVNSAIIFKV